MLGDERFDVVLGDTSAKTRSRNLRQVNLVLFGNLANQRAGAKALLVASFGNPPNPHSADRFNTPLLLLRCR